MAPSLAEIPRKPRPQEEDELSDRIALAERRSRIRYPLDLPVTYRAFDRELLSEEGQAVNLSSNGVLIFCQHPLEAGTQVELRMQWPSLLQSQVPLQLVTVGRVVRSGPSHFAVSFQRHQFRTAGRKRERVAN